MLVDMLSEHESQPAASLPPPPPLFVLIGHAASLRSFARARSPAYRLLFQALSLREGELLYTCQTRRVQLVRRGGTRRVQLVRRGGGSLRRGAPWYDWPLP